MDFYTLTCLPELTFKKESKCNDMITGPNDYEIIYD